MKRIIEIMCVVIVVLARPLCPALSAADASAPATSPSATPPSATQPPNPAAAAAAAAAASSTPAVQLPPMLVEESVSSVPWLYVNAGGTEFLSRCSAGVTRDLVSAWLAQVQLIRVLVPEDFLIHLDVPSVFVLYAQDLQQTLSADIQRELHANAVGAGEVDVAPSMRLADRDMSASIAYVDEALFNGSDLSIAPSHIRYLVRGRVPELPGWVVDGVERAAHHVDFLQNPVTLLPLVWGVSGESDAIGWDPLRPRAVLPASDLFASDTWAAAQNHHLRHTEMRTSTEELFFRWATLAGGATRDAYWKFAARAAEGPVTEEDFEKCFGFDYAELRDRLSDYLSKAVWESKTIDPGIMPRLGRLRVERATPNQIARVRGEWERMAIGHVQRRLPQARGPYIAQARRTLNRAFEAGDRDPRLLATMGLCEVDGGNDSGARAFLEPAVAAGVVRPRAYYELARLLFAELRRGQPETKTFTYVELGGIIRPLRKAIPQAPPLPEVFALLAEVWSRCDNTPDPAEFADLLLGAKLFARRPSVAIPTARALANHGRKAEAATVLANCANFAVDPESRAEIARLRAQLGTVSAVP